MKNFEVASKQVGATSRGVKLIFRTDFNFAAVSLCDEIVAMRAGLKIIVEMRTASALQPLSPKDSS
jgi:hypothetical protein